ncbi:MAG TPA: sigma-70 family RNA polymerase sigma factor [Gemmatimonadales bacterium]|nr:sigma-70 family RNA polymerase sigma factor [Gemmatimonadales bacterium]
MSPVPAEPEAPQDLELVAAWQGGDERAATRLVERHTPAIARFLAGAGAPPSDLDDLVQETFFRAFRRLGSWRGESALRSWLFSIAANLLRDEFRRRKGRQVIPIDDRDVPAPGRPDGEFEADEAERRIRAGLADLPRLQREVFLLRAQQGIGYDEIAVALGTTPGAARVHYHHAVKRLKELVR